MISSASWLCVLAWAIRLSNPEGVCQMAPHVAAAAEVYQLDPRLLVAMAEVETRWRPDCVQGQASCVSQGNVGLVQIQPRWSSSPARPKGSSGLPRAHTPALTRQELLHAVTNLWAAARLLRAWIDDYGLDIPEALCGYNAGVRRCEDARGVIYSRHVLKVWRRMTHP